jgi:alpha-tubulin suppressor-like RCC1 family protein
VSMGDAHACGLRADGRVACWGCGFDGAVGPGASRTRYEPEVVSRGASRVFATRNHTCVREGAGALACAGGFFRTRAGISASSTFRPLAIEHADRVVDVEETSRGLVVLYDDGEAALLSDGAIGARPIGGGMRALVPNTPGLCALDRAGALSCWDDPYQTETFDLAPVEGIEPGLSAAVGAFGSCVNTASGTLSCVAPSGRRAPTFATAGRVVAIAGEHDLCALFDNRELGCHRSDGTREVAVSHVKAFAMGIGHVCAIVDGDREQVRCAGEGYRGELGTESAVASDFRLVPGLVAPTGDPHFVEIAAGDHHTCVRRIDGAVVCWGADSSGQLGRLPDSFRADPVEVPLE